MSLTEVEYILYEASTRIDVITEELDIQTVTNVNPDQRSEMMRAQGPHLALYCIQVYNSADREAREETKQREDYGRKLGSCIGSV